MEISQAEGGTRSGLLWEVERILNELDRERESGLVLKSHKNMLIWQMKDYQNKLSNVIYLMIKICYNTPIK